MAFHRGWDVIYCVFEIAKSMTGEAYEIYCKQSRDEAVRQQHYRKVSCPIYRVDGAGGSCLCGSTKRAES